MRLRTIQDVGQEFFDGNLKQLYFFLGSEYGIKQKYIELAEKHYNTTHIEKDSIDDIISLFSVARLFPLAPTVYVVRYDSEFLTKLTDKNIKTLEKLKIIGTLICIYEDSAQCKKIANAFPDYSISIDKVNPQFVVKYLTNDFPTMSNIAINNIVSITDNYALATTICQSLSMLPIDIQNQITPMEMRDMFGLDVEINDDFIKCCIAARDFKNLMNIIDYINDFDRFLYDTTSVCLELEKLKTNQHGKSILAPYVDYWTIADIYTLFNITYEELKLTRQGKLARDSACYIATSIQFSPIPNLRERCD